jgi:endothelin-converting enzyme/putative endopeptidase
MDLHIGFPDRWPEAGSYALDPNGFLANVVAARRFGQAQAWARAGALRDRSRWQEEVYPWVGIGMAAERLTVPNGFPDPYSNSLVMTAAFLMPPRLAKGAPAEANYATYGVTFGHELTHVLEYHVVDAEGRPNDIWEPSDVKAHDAKQSCVIDQADAFVPAPGLRNRGERQSDENIADLGGIRLAHAALAERLGAAMTVRGPDGRTPEQRFFLRYAQSYCAAQTPERLAAGVAGDPHGPAEFRVNGPLANLPAFARAFGCGAGDTMVRPAAKMCRIW